MSSRSAPTPSRRRRGAETVDLPGALVMPGLHDAHIHTEWLSRDLSSVDLREARSLEETLELVRAHAEGLPEGEWLHSGRWNHNRWAVPEQPDRHALDSVSGDRVAALSSVDGHTIWANSLALQRAGITRDTPDPVGGEIVRDASGEPTGHPPRVGAGAARRHPARGVTAAALARALPGLAALGRPHEHHRHRRRGRPRGLRRAARRRRPAAARHEVHARPRPRARDLRGTPLGPG